MYDATLKSQVFTHLAFFMGTDCSVSIAESLISVSASFSAH